jgi:hypothetical protein
MTKNFRMTVQGAAVFALAAVLTAQPATAKPRGNSGLPPGPGNPIAAVQGEVVKLQGDITKIEGEIGDLQKEIDAINDLLNASALMWIEHLDFLSGDPAVLTTSFLSTNSGVGGGLSGLIVQSSTVGSTDSHSGIKVIEKAVQVPPHFSITGVRVCYEWSAGATSSIDRIRLSQVQDPPSTALVKLDDSTAHSGGPLCVDSAVTSVDPSLGSVLLDIGINTVNVADKLVLRAVGLHLVPTAP